MEKKRLSLISGIVALFLPIVAFAQPHAVIGPVMPMPNVCRLCLANENYVKCLMNNIINCVVWPLLVFVVVVMFLLAGLRFLTARGDAAKIETAKKIAIWGVVGVAFCVISFSIIATARWLLGV